MSWWFENLSAPDSAATLPRNLPSLFQRRMSSPTKLPGTTIPDSTIPDSTIRAIPARKTKTTPFAPTSLARTNRAPTPLAPTLAQTIPAANSAPTTPRSSRATISKTNCACLILPLLRGGHETTIQRPGDHNTRSTGNAQLAARATLHRRGNLPLRQLFRGNKKQAAQGEESSGLVGEVLRGGG